MDDFDLIVVGAGIAGGSLATVIARQGARVLVLERQTVYLDRVRGKLLGPWGVEVARRLGIEAVLLYAGALVVRWLLGHDEGSDDPTHDDIGAAIEGVSGSMNLT